MKIYIGSDHGGLRLRGILARALVEWGHQVVAEEGPKEPGESVDYPDVATSVCRQILQDEGAIGVLVCGTGQGMAMTANRIPGIRAGVVSDCFSAKMTRAHNNANVLCLGERVLGEELALEILRQFVQGDFEGGRHERRVAKIMAAAEGTSPPGESAAKG